MTEKPHFVLGQQFAAAKKAEDERLAQGFGRTTPLGAMWQYDRWVGEFDLVNPTRQHVDNKVQALAIQFATAGPEDRDIIRGHLNLNDFYTLINFGKRCAVFAMRSRESRDVTDGLTALAMIELKRVDPRDAIGAMGLLWSAATTIGAQGQPLFENAAVLAEPGMASTLLNFITGGAKNLRMWGYAVIETHEGSGLVRSGWDRYEPRCGLAEIAFDIAHLIEKKNYRAEVRLATSLPKVWLSGIDNDALAQAMEATVACAIVSGHLRPEASADYQWQHFMVIVLETTDKEAAGALERLARTKREQTKGVAMVGLRQGYVFALVIGRSAKAGGKAFETATTILRFEGGIRHILNERLGERNP